MSGTSKAVSDSHGHLLPCFVRPGREIRRVCPVRAELRYGKICSAIITNRFRFISGNFRTSLENGANGDILRYYPSVPFFTMPETCRPSTSSTCHLLPPLLLSSLPVTCSCHLLWQPPACRLLLSCRLPAPAATKKRDPAVSLFCCPACLRSEPRLSEYQSRNPSRTSCSRILAQSATGRFSPSTNRSGHPRLQSSM